MGIKIKWDRLQLRTLKKWCSEILKYDVTSKTLKLAHAEATKFLLDFWAEELSCTCQNCGSPVDTKILKCWACGLVLRCEEELVEVGEPELRVRAAKLGIEVPDGNSVSVEEIEARIDAKRKYARTIDVLTLEAAKLNEEATLAMPDGWKKAVTKLYTAYFDSDGVRRFAIFNRGLRVDFSVPDGFFDGYPDFEFITNDERRRRHFGRTNYVYRGNGAKQVLEYINLVFESYASFGN